MDIKFYNHIILDQISSWPKNIIRLLKDSKIHLQKYLDEERRIARLTREVSKYSYSRPTNKNERIWNKTLKAIESELTNKKFVGFHCSRLMDYEISDILENGLCPLSLDFANSRIRKLFEKGSICKGLSDKLINLEDLSDPNRVNNLNFFHCKTSLKIEQGIIDFFRFWGGESIYYNFDKRTELQRIGIPCIIMGSIDRDKLLECENHSLPKQIIHIYLNDGCSSDPESCVHENIKVLRVLKYNDKVFKVLTNIDNWEESIIYDNNTDKNG